MERSRPDDEDIVGSRSDEQSEERTGESRGRRREEREEQPRGDDFNPTSQGDDSGEVM